MSVLTAATYLPAGPPATLDLGPSGTVHETLGHDWQYRRTTQTVGSWIDLSYDYDDAGNLETVTDTGGTRDATYTYDDLSRLATADLDGEARGYEYDPIGNITRQTVGTGGDQVTYSYDQVGGQNTPVLASITGPWGPEETVVTDAAGNITDDGSQTYVPDLRNHLGERALGAATLVNTFTADGRLARTETTGQTLTQLLDPAGRRLALHRSTTGWRDYVYLGDRLLGYFDDGDTAAKLVFTDHIGMPMLVVDGGGVVRWSSRAEPYGQLRDTVDKTFDPGLRYPGQWQDWLELEASCDGFGMCTLPTPIQESFSLFENGYRWYRPAWGRYSQPDSLGQKGDLNLFVYAHAMPLAFLDHDGRFGLSSTDMMELMYDYLRLVYDDLHRRRVEGHRRFPGEPDSQMRHCVVSCETALAWSDDVAFWAGVGNEVQGFLWHDIRHLPGRLTNESPWAASPQDFEDNLQGIACAGFIGKQCRTCEECCSLNCCFGFK